MGFGKFQVIFLLPPPPEISMTQHASFPLGWTLPHTQHRMKQHNERVYGIYTGQWAEFCLYCHQFIEHTWWLIDIVLL